MSESKAATVETDQEVVEELIEDVLDMGERGEPTEYLEPYQFDVREEEVMTDSGIIIPNMRAIIREDTETVVGTVGSHYKILSHKDALDPILHGLKKKKIETFKRVNLTDGGAKMYASIFFPGAETEIGKNDDVWPGISIVNSLDGSLKYMAEMVLYRLACTNGMRVPERLAGFSSMHSKNKEYEDFVEQILSAVDNGSQFNTFNQLANKGMKTDGVELYIDKILDDKRSNFPLRYKQMVMAEIAGMDNLTYNTITLWDIYNAFQSVIEHHIIRCKGKLQRGRALEDNLFKYFEKNAIKVMDKK